jgi:ornithine cyclodeaminase/alanine dehydrogenase-like protein (mu-crystallin family)
VVHGDVPRHRTARLGLTVAGALVNRGVLTVGLLGAGALADEYLALLPDLLPTVSQVALFDPDDRAADELLDRLVEPLRRRGVQLCVERHARDVVRGTDLVLLADAVHAAPLRASWLAAGAVVLHLGERRLPIPLRAAADVLLTAAEPRAVLLAVLACRLHRTRLIVVDLPTRLG